ncbi:MAG: M3 family oligoendopeptidase, partial [Anaerolineae bacterium]|nr:M3 family oligoendopeptidase [Anaerolineae bacterium]
MSKNNTPIDTLPRWDMTNVYPALDSKEFKSGVEELKGQLNRLGEFMKTQKISPSSPAGKDPAKLAETTNRYLEQMNTLLRLYGTLSAYVYSFVSTDSFNAEAKKAESELDQLGVRVKQLDTEFKGWVGTMGEVLPKVLEHEGEVRSHAFYLTETAEQSKFLMGGAEEALAAELSLSGSTAWGKLQGTLTSQLTWPLEQEDGSVENQPMTAIINLRSHTNELMRRRGYEAELAAWKTIEEPLAAALNGIKGEVNTLNKRRGRSDAIHSSIDTARIDRDTLEAMLGAMKASFPMFRKYFKAKAKRLGKDSLPWWDVFAPGGTIDRSYSYPEAKDFVLENFANFSPDLANFAKRSFDHNWIDVGPREGKRAGAFCMGVPGVDESRILLNFDGSLDSVSTLAHELGHGFHNDCLVGKPELRTVTPMTLAETASIMCQTIITDASLEAATSPDEELAILENDLIDASQVVVDIYSRYLFEKEVFERRAGAELSAAELSEIMERAQKETYGDGLDEKYLQKYMWTWKPHYYYAGFSFYNYPYAFGLLFATGLYAIYQERGADFVPEYKDLLASTGEGSAAELAARFGIDIRTTEFWENSLKVIGKRVER